jgi:hypothetical protein
MQMLGTEVLFGFQLQGAFHEGFASASPAARVADAIALSLIVVTLGLLIAAPCQHRLVERGEATLRIITVANRFAEIALTLFAIALGCDLYVVTERYWGAAPALAGGAALTAVALFAWYGSGATLRLLIPRRERERDLPAESRTELHVKIDQMLTEARVILPGVQALLGFQFVVTMTKAFHDLPLFERDIHFAALGAILLAIMLLLMPGALHRLTFGGADVPRFYDIGSTVVTVALAPLALGLSADFYIALTQILRDRALAALSAGVVLLLLATLWYGVPLLLRQRV